GLAGAKAAVFADEEIEVRALLLRELEKNAFALGVLEAFAVAFEEAVRAPLAADADEQRLLIVDPGRQFFGAGREQAVCRALEKQKCRLRVERGIFGEELAVSLFQRGEMLAFLVGETLE